MAHLGSWQMILKQHQMCKIYVANAGFVTK